MSEQTKAQEQELEQEATQAEVEAEQAAQEQVDGEAELSPEEEIAGLHAELEAAKQTIEDQKDSVVRAAAETENVRRRAAQDVQKLLQSAIANAENNHGLDVDRLVVSEATVGKTMLLKRFHARGRGRGARVLKKVSNMTITVKEAAE